MICLRCLTQSSGTKLPLRPLRNLRVQPKSNSIISRSFTHATARPNAAQPFTTPVAASPTARDAAPESLPSKKKEVVAVRSSVPAGTVLKGLNFHKDKSDPIAMEDSEYPDWLWKTLTEVRTAGGLKEVKAESAKSLSFPF
jgi:large subunit ribosomal protein L54